MELVAKKNHWVRGDYYLFVRLMGIVLKVTQNLLYVDDLWAGIPSHSTTHQIPVLTLLHGNTLQRGER